VGITNQCDEHMFPKYEFQERQMTGNSSWHYETIINIRSIMFSDVKVDFLSLLPVPIFTDHNET
jgi:hypothetical protein